jgi:hypothetical protein
VPVSQDQSWINWLLYGDPGVGKTVLLGTSPKCLILEADDGSESAAIQGSKAEKWKMNDWADMLEAYEYLRHEDHGYEWVWLDSCTLFQESGLDMIMEDLVAGKPHRSIYLPDRGEYQENMRRLGMWVRNMKPLPFNFGITAHAMRVADDESETEMMWPLIQGKNMPQKLCGYMGLVTYMTVRKTAAGKERILITDKTAKYYAKDRFDALGGRMLNPTVPKIQELVAKRLPQKG